MQEKKRKQPHLPHPVLPAATPNGGWSSLLPYPSPSQLIGTGTAGPDLRLGLSATKWPEPIWGIAPVGSRPIPNYKQCLQWVTAGHLSKHRPDQDLAASKTFRHTLDMVRVLEILSYQHRPLRITRYHFCEIITLRL